MYKFNPEVEYWNIVDRLFAGATLGFIASQLSIEAQKLYKNKYLYFKTMWGWLSILSIILNLAFTIGDYCNVSLNKMIPLGAVSVMIMWTRAFYFLKLFSKTGALLRMVIQVFIDIKILALACLLAVVAFGNAFYLLGLNSI
jgi:hypothetical protein